MANPNEVVCQFTEDAFAAEDRVCERPNCRAQIAKGQPCFYVATMQPGRSGRNVCAPCYRRYEMRSVTSKRPTSELIATFSMSFTDVFMLALTPAVNSQHLSSELVRPDPQIIRKSVNAAQRKCKLLALT
jgi:hypothetical protein